MDEADDDLAAQIAWLQQEAALRRQEVARQDAELAELAALIAENKGHAQELLRMEAERWERLAMPDPSFDAALEPKRADHHGEEPFRTLMGYAIRGELEDLAAQMYAYGDPMFRVLLGLSMTVAAYIMFDVCGRLPPTEADVRKIAEITMRNEFLADAREAAEDPEITMPFTVSQDKVHDYLARAVFQYEDITTVFGPMEASTLPLFFTAAMVTAFRPAGMQWWEYLDQIWDAIEFAERTPLAVLPALHLRAHRVAKFGTRRALPPAPPRG
jgi:hypothetical protein